jgi:CheY-like chemotaxis protein
MPEMTGYDLLKAIKVVNLLADFKLILKWNETERIVGPTVNCQALSSPNPIPVVVMSSENEPQRISRWWTTQIPLLPLSPASSCHRAKAKQMPFVTLHIHASESHFCSLAVFCAWFNQFRPFLKASRI